MPYTQHPLILEGERVRLEPLDNVHLNDLLEISAQEDVWKYLSLVGADRDQLLSDLKSAQLKRLTGEQYPFAIIDKRTGKAIGSTRLYNTFPEHRKLEIGWTFYNRRYWGSGYNLECKLLLLTYCFETLKTVRVQLQTHEQNHRSRAAIQKIGGKLEGILRNERIRPGGEVRNTAVFSIIDSEWDEVKKMLKEKVSTTFDKEATQNI
ncbi:MAG: N-acetyltransferase [Sphingobacteriales bacterium]|nr:MAG: N-acetyltransferase [Sphingobacteriales bacterium]